MTQEARSIGQPEPTTLGLFGGNLQPLLSPDPFNPLVVDDPTRTRPQQLRDFSVAVATILPSQFDDVGCQFSLVVAPLGRLALGRAVLTERRARTTLGDLEFTPHVLDHGASC